MRSEIVWHFGGRESLGSIGIAFLIFVIRFPHLGQLMRDLYIGHESG